MDEGEYQTNFPLEEASSHLNVTLKLLQAAQDQWMGEKESLLHEIERLRLENRTLRMEIRNNENLERNSVSVTPFGNRQNSYILLGQDAGQFAPISGSTARQVVTRSSSSALIGSARARRVPEVTNLVNNVYPMMEFDSNSGSRNQSPKASPASGSQNCRVRKIQLDEEHSDHEPSEKRQKFIKFREVGRNIGKKSERNNLEAFECTECSKFYKAISNGKAGGPHNLCKHQKQNPLLQDSGKHRYKYPPLKSPPGYWDLDNI
ncbi:CtIP type zinc knuckle (C2H2) [Cryptosporidium felis]|nr:CtIP type zinc knuckle (C2H2) [Cryptosporidium felis]